jgi:hypothetical protein
MVFLIGLGVLLAADVFAARYVLGQMPPSQSSEKELERAKFREFLRSLAIPSRKGPVDPRRKTKLNPLAKSSSGAQPTEEPSADDLISKPTSGTMSLSSVSAGKGDASVTGGDDVSPRSNQTFASDRCALCGSKVVNGKCSGRRGSIADCPLSSPSANGGGKHGESGAPMTESKGSNPSAGSDRAGDSRSDSSRASKDSPNSSSASSAVGKRSGPVDSTLDGKTASEMKGNDFSDSTAQSPSDQPARGTLLQLPGGLAPRVLSRGTEQREPGTRDVEGSKIPDTSGNLQSDLDQQLANIDINAQRVIDIAGQQLGGQPLGGIGGPQGHIPQDPLGMLGPISQLFGAINASAGVGPGLKWRTVRPAGNRPDVNRSAVSMKDADANDTGDASESKQLNIGVLRSDLLAGEKNPLLLPPHIASVVYVVDCSGSMAGINFQKIASAISDAIRQMSVDQKFFVLLFNNAALQIEDGGLLPATEENKLMIQQQLSQVSPVGGTDPTDAILIAIQAKPKTIVVFSDGEFDGPVVDTVTRLNRTSGYNIQINGVGVGAGVSSLRRLASLNGPGTYFEVP